MNIADGGIIIVAQPRTGSTNLQKSICSYYKKKIIFEPNFMLEQVYDPNNDVVKMFPYHPDYHTDKQDFDYDKILNKIKQFNTIILLNRRNKKEQTDSMYIVHKVHEGIYDDPWFDSQVNTEDKAYKDMYDFFASADEIHQRIASDLNLEINYYEDVFEHKKLNIDIGLDLDYFSKGLKLRNQSKRHKTLI